jgi:hypothetical protein
MTFYVAISEPGNAIPQRLNPSFTSLTAAITAAKRESLTVVARGGRTLVFDADLGQPQDEVTAVIAFQAVNGEPTVQRPLDCRYTHALRSETPQDLQEYRVHLYTSARVDVADITAGSPQEAVRLADEALSRHLDPSRRNEHGNGRIEGSSMDDAVTKQALVAPVINGVPDYERETIMSHSPESVSTQLLIQFSLQAFDPSTKADITGMQVAVYPLSAQLNSDIEAIEEMLYHPNSQSSYVDLGIENSESLFGDKFSNQRLRVTRDGVQIFATFESPGKIEPNLSQLAVSNLIAHEDLRNAAEWGVYPVAPLTPADLSALPIEPIQACLAEITPSP